MKRDQLIDAINLVDDDLIAKAQIAKSDIKQNNRYIRALIAACFVLIIAIPSFILIHGTNPKDPSWSLANKQMSSVEEVEKLCGNLLYKNLNYNNTKEVNFTLNFDKNYINDSSHYNWLDCYIQYNDEENNDKISLYIYFPNNKDKITDWYKFKGTQKNINGVTVIYSDMSDVEEFSISKYSGCAKFDYNGNTYVLEAFSDKRENVLIYYLGMIIPSK